jgi:hypothetical protein
MEGCAMAEIPVDSVMHPTIVFKPSFRACSIILLLGYATTFH